MQVTEPVEVIAYLNHSTEESETSSCADLSATLEQQLKHGQLFCRTINR